MKRVFAWLTVCLLALALAGCGTASPAETVPTEADKTDDNYRVFYEIFVRIFSIILLNVVSENCKLTLCPNSAPTASRTFPFIEDFIS